MNPLVPTATLAEEVFDPVGTTLVGVEVTMEDSSVLVTLSSVVKVNVELTASNVISLF